MYVSRPEKSAESETNCPEGMALKKDGMTVASGKKKKTKSTKNHPFLVKCASYVPPPTPTPPDPRVYIFQSLFENVKLKENPESFLLSKVFFLVFALFNYLVITTFLV